MFVIRGISKTTVIATALLFTSAVLHAQSKTGGDSSTPFIVGLIAIVILFALWLLVMVAEHLLRVTARQMGAEKAGINYSIFPQWSEIFNPNKQFAFIPQGSRIVKLKKGFNLNLAGSAVANSNTTTNVTRYTLTPSDFKGMSPIPKIMVEEKAEVKAGDILFFDKKNPEVKYAAPVSGEVISVTRGEKRSIVGVTILADKNVQYRSYNLPALSADRGELVAFLLESGVWPFIHQRPFNTIANHHLTPKNIFVSTFDSAPLAPDSNLQVAGETDAFAKGLEVLTKLTSGKVYMGINANQPTAPAFANVDVEGVVKTWFSGAHPAGNVGVQIHHTAPINKGDVVWTMDVVGVLVLGRLFLHGKFDTSRWVALTGAELRQPSYARVYQGANIGELLADNLSNNHVRIIAGDVLTGKKVSTENYLGFFDDQITVVAEGDYYEMFGWLLPLKPRPSLSPTFPKMLYPEHIAVDTNTHGEKRAFVVTGQYEQVLPMDIYPQHLLKAILANDYEKMEGLGIYEVVEEDVALCEFVCTSKQPVQEILGKGIEMMAEQG